RALDRVDPERREDPAAPCPAGAQDGAGAGTRPLGACARRRSGPGRLCRAGAAPRMTGRATPARARRSVSTIFFVNGTVLASWVPHIPAVKAEHAIGDGALGLVLLSMAAGAALAGLAIGLGVPPTCHVVASAAVALLAVGRALRWLVPSDAADARPTPVFARSTGVLFGLGVLAFFGLLAEGAMADWSAVYLRDTLETTPAVAAAGFAAFSLAMAAGRFRGDRLVSLLGPGRLLGASGAVAACGLGGALLVGAPAAAVVGCGLVGFGISNVIPVLFSAAGHVRGIQAGTALAAVATIGYLGLLAGPPLIGLTAHVTSLPVALGLVSAFCAAIGVGGRALVPAVIPARSAPS